MSNKTPAPKNNLLSKRRTKKEINLVIKANSQFKEFIETIKTKPALEEMDLENLAMLQEHLGNLNIHFVDVLKNFK